TATNLACDRRPDAVEKVLAARPCRLRANRGVTQRVTRSATEFPREVPLPEPQKPDREPERRPTYELRGLSLDEASVWVADLRQRLREFSSRNAGASLRVAVVSADGERVPVTDVQAGPGAGYVTLLVSR